MKIFLSTILSLNFFKVFFYFFFIFSGSLKWIELPFGLDLTLIMIIFCFGFIIISLNKFIKPRFDQYLIFGLILLLNVLFLISNLYTISTVYANYKTQGIILNIFTVIYPILVFRKSIFNELKLLMYIVGVIVIPVLFFLYFNGLFVIFHDSAQFIDKVPNYLTIGIMLSSCFIFSMSSKDNIYMWIYRLSILFLLLQLGGRGPILNLLIVLLLFFFIHYRNVKLGLKFKLICLFLPIILLFYSQEIYLSISEFDFNRFNLIDAFRSDNSFGARIDFLRSGFNSILTYPFFGLGIGSSGLIVYGTDEIGYPHNLMIEAIMELGIIGGLIYICVYFYLVKYNWRLLRTNKPLTVLFLISILFYFEDNKSNSFDSWRISIFWIMMFLIEKRHNFYTKINQLSDYEEIEDFQLDTKNLNGSKI